MAEQASGAVAETGSAQSPAHGADQTLGHGEHLGHNPGSPMSWVAVAVIVVGFIVGIPAMVPHMRWWLFWIGVGIVLVGCIMTAAVRTFRDDWY